MTLKNEMENLFLRKKPVNLILKLKDGQQKYVSILAKETNCTYSHTVKTLEIFKNKNLVRFDKSGRIKYVSLTKDGEELANRFDNVMKKFSRIKVNDKQAS